MLDWTGADVGVRPGEDRDAEWSGPNLFGHLGQQTPNNMRHMLLPNIPAPTLIQLMF